MTHAGHRAYKKVIKSPGDLQEQSTLQPQEVPVRVPEW